MVADTLGIVRIAFELSHWHVLLHHRAKGELYHQEQDCDHQEPSKSGTPAPIKMTLAYVWWRT